MSIKTIETEPEQCANCGSTERMTETTADVNGSPTKGFLCDECGHFHYVKIPTLTGVVTP
jgi:uncharacterized Zn finger protein